MATPFQKSDAIESALIGLVGFDRRDSIEADKCVPAPIGCGQAVDHDAFQTLAGRREYRISGLCAVCQLRVFGSA